nr:MAG TPA: hypothetical protein [Caudoviricetes sp.]
MLGGVGERWPDKTKRYKSLHGLTFGLRLGSVLRLGICAGFTPGLHGGYVGMVVVHRRRE